MNNNRIWEMENGEFINHRCHNNIRKRYKADTPFDNAIVPYLIMVFCAVVDGCVFYSLFQKISYDNPMLLAIQIAGFLFAFEVIPIFLAIQYRRLRQGLSKDRFLLILALAACILAFALNIILRLTTIDQMSPNFSANSTSYFGNVEQQDVNSTDPIAVALTIFGIGIPMVTTLGSFFISYLTYNPLLIRKRREEEMIETTRDEVRRFEAILSAYDAEPDFAEALIADDDKKFQAMKHMQRAVVLGYCEYVRQLLKEHLGTPYANTYLSEENCQTILNRLDRDLISLQTPEVPASGNTTSSTIVRLLPEEGHA